MNYFESKNKSKYVASNVKEILHKKLILSKPLNINEENKLNPANTHFVTEEEKIPSKTMVLQF
ncbi:hypothetical protein [Lysinibacillus fusiformis]